MLIMGIFRKKPKIIDEWSALPSTLQGGTSDCIYLYALSYILSYNQ